MPISIEIVIMFYSLLYASLAPNAQGEDRHAKLLSHIPNKFSLVAQKALEAPITEVELTSAIHAMAKGKSTGPDGLIVDFYKAY